MALTVKIQYISIIMEKTYKLTYNVHMAISDVCMYLSYGIIKYATYITATHYVRSCIMLNVYIHS